MMLSAVPLDWTFQWHGFQIWKCCQSGKLCCFQMMYNILYIILQQHKLLQILFALPGWIDWSSVSDWHSIIKSSVYSELSNHHEHRSGSKSTCQSKFSSAPWRAAAMQASSQAWSDSNLWNEGSMSKQQHCSSQPTTHNHHDMSVLLCDSESKLCNTCHWFSVWCC